MLVLFIPQAQSAERDIGYQVILPVDHNAVVDTADCPTVISATEIVVQVLHQDPGDNLSELRVFSGLEAKSPAELNGALPKGDVKVNDFFQRQCTRVYDMNIRYKATKKTMSTSNGGAGY